MNGEYSYVWNIPTNTNLTVGNVGKIKVKAVTPATQNSVAGTSGGFQVKGSIALVNPLSGASDMAVGGTKTIVWTPSGNIAKYIVAYKTTAAGAYNDITPAGGVAGTVNGSNREWVWPTPTGARR